MIPTICIAYIAENGRPVLDQISIGTQPRLVRRVDLRSRIGVSFDLPKTIRGYLPMRAPTRDSLVIQHRVSREHILVSFLDLKSGRTESFTYDLVNLMATVPNKPLSVVVKSHREFSGHYDLRAMGRQFDAKLLTWSPLAIRQTVPGKLWRSQAASAAESLNRARRVNAGGYNVFLERHFSPFAAGSFLTPDGKQTLVECQPKEKKPFGYSDLLYGHFSGSWRWHSLGIWSGIYEVQIDGVYAFIHGTRAAADKKTVTVLNLKLKKIIGTWQADSFCLVGKTNVDPYLSYDGKTLERTAKSARVNPRFLGRKGSFESDKQIWP